MGYMNKSLVMFSFLTLLAISCASSRKKPIIKENGVIADMVLMYYGGVHRQTEWNEEQCMKNVAYRDKKGDLHWMSPCPLGKVNGKACAISIFRKVKLWMLLKAVLTM